MPDPILVGRNADKIEALAQAHGIERWTTDLDAALANPRRRRLLRRRHDADARPSCLARAIAAGKHVYCEKPIATTLAEALELAALAEKAGVKNGVVRTSCSCPGC